MLEQAAVSAPAFSQRSPDDPEVCPEGRGALAALGMSTRGCADGAVTAWRTSACRPCARSSPLAARRSELALSAAATGGAVGAEDCGHSYQQQQQQQPGGGCGRDFPLFSVKFSPFMYSTGFMPGVSCRIQL